MTTRDNSQFHTALLIPLASDAGILYSPTIYTASDGCASAVNRILGKVDGVQSIDAKTDIESKLVVVQADDSVVSQQVLLEKLSKVRTART